MKNYLTIAAVLGVIAFASVSFLAKADQQPAGAAEAATDAMKAAPAADDPSDGEAAADKAASIPQDDKFAKDDDDCANSADQPHKDGTSATDSEKEAAYRKCMQMKGHSAAEMKAQGVGDIDKKDEKAAGKNGGKNATHDQGEPADE